MDRTLQICPFDEYSTRELVNSLLPKIKQSCVTALERDTGRTRGSRLTSPCRREDHVDPFATSRYRLAAGLIRNPMTTGS